MITVLPKHIPQIDEYAERVLGVPTRTLMERAGEGVAAAITARLRPSRVLVFCGGGNNGGDGYAAALSLAARGFSPLAVDVFGKGQKSEAGKHFLAEYKARFGEPLSLLEALKTSADVLVDAVFGTGFSGAVPAAAEPLFDYFKKSTAYKVAIDIPLGVDAESGRLAPSFLRVDLTVTLCFVKKGLLSYPARDAVGELVNCDLGLDAEVLKRAFSLPETVDGESLSSLLPKRSKNSHKGSFGRVCALVGSDAFVGAALLAAEGALRGGCGLFTLASTDKVLAAAMQRLPEILALPLPAHEAMGEKDREALFSNAALASALLVGSGCGKSEALYRILLSLLSSEGAPLAIDADGLNAIAAYGADIAALFSTAKRPVVLTPHPLEMARLIGKTVGEVQENRLALAEEYAKKWGVTLVLKGAGTVIADREGSAVSTVGDSALAKGGSGDVLAGLIASLLAQGASPRAAAEAAVYLHGKAGERLAARLSPYGVLPSDLPLEIAALMAEILKKA